jgi:hypothetical protein
MSLKYANFGYFSLHINIVCDLGIGSLPREKIICVGV